MKTWSMSVADENVRVFEWNVLRNIYVPVKEDEIWRIISNYEMEEILKG